MSRLSEQVALGIYATAGVAVAISIYRTIQHRNPLLESSHHGDEEGEGEDEWTAGGGQVSTTAIATNIPVVADSIASSRFSPQIQRSRSPYP